MNYYVLAYYRFVPIADPVKLVADHQAFFQGRDVKCRIYVSHEGINGQFSGALSDAESYMEWLKGDERFKDLEFKIHLSHENVFPKVTVKVRKQIVALDEEVDISLTGEHVSPEKWKEMIEKRDEDTVILDTRNIYEWHVGHFEGAELPTLEQFREFPKYARHLKETKDPEKTKVMMYCTGGIRCELYSALLKKIGFKKVFQLEGGVIKYGLEKGSQQWKGKLFVFDDRLTVPLSDDAQTISRCRHCDTLSDIYYNCANMDCNELFTCCPSCAEKLQGCCCNTCLEAPRLRPYEKSGRPKPFRKAVSQNVKQQVKKGP